MYQLINDLRIVECASFIAGPSCTLHLQQLGAEVIRIDPIGGGPDFHRWPVSDEHHSFYWEGLNKGKRSIQIDLADPEGRALAQAIITAPGTNSGIFVTNFPRRSFLSHESLCEKRSDLITVRIAGWSDGEPAVDYTVNAATGIPYMTGEESGSGDPVNHVLPAWDLMTGAYAAFAVLAAERSRRSTNQGGEVIVPLSDVAIASLGHLGQIAEVLTQGDRPRSGNALFGAFGRDFVTNDGNRVMVVAITARQWSALLNSLALSEQIATLEKTLDVSFAFDEGVRFRFRDRLFPLFERAIASRTLDEISKRFRAEGVCWSVYRTLKDALASEPRFSLQGPLFGELEHPSGHRYPAPGSAATFIGRERLAPHAAPLLGTNTDEILGEVMHLSPSEIGKLHDRGIVK
ncbi:CoA transferase [Caballeronia sp. GAWG2-1]|uniref:CoA transferase n=1 Tax=Caballeronia sp. GAWG2-1 TaxID=2921744 RepID=UPI0020283C0C|nr:CoA transferase [Caballeronia sp. GAWG2-1]